MTLGWLKSNYAKNHAFQMAKNFLPFDGTAFSSSSSSFSSFSSSSSSSPGGPKSSSSSSGVDSEHQHQGNVTKMVEEVCSTETTKYLIIP